MKNNYVTHNPSLNRNESSHKRRIVESSNENQLKKDFANLRIDSNPPTEFKDYLNVLNSNKSTVTHLKNSFEKQLTQKENSNTDNLQHQPQQDEILCETFTGDGKQKLVSKCLKGKVLSKATLDQLALNQKDKKRVFPLLVNPGCKLLNYEETKHANKSVGLIASYAANTNQGISRNYNQDRVSIILNISKNNVKCSLFAIYDGHGGNACCDYLRDVLHQHIINNPKFPSNPKQAIISGVRIAEQGFLDLVKQEHAKENRLDRSGSCAIVVMIIGCECYVVNIGDSRAIMSAQNGKYSYNLSRDHKPTDPVEQKRIQDAGGKIYRTELKTNNNEQPVFGPLRVFPGKLSVSRTFGDVEAKLQKFGGNSKVIVAEPEIKHFEIKANHDFIILGSDGIYDKLDSRDIIKVVWNTVQNNRQTNLHELCALCVEQVLREVMNRRGLDNITLVMIAFKGFEARVKELQDQQYRTK